MSAPLLVLGLVLFVLLVIVHEYGHYRAARKGGVVVEEFGIGFPPKVWGKRLKSKMLFSVNLLPLGGFVRLKGEADADTEKGSYGAASLSRKVKIMTAGVVMNTIVALVMLTLIAVIGMPKLFDNQFAVNSDIKTVKKQVLVARVTEGSPAEKAGIQATDELVSIAPTKVDGPVTDAESLSDQTSRYAGQNVTVQVIRGGEDLSLEASLLSKEEVDISQNSDDPKGYLGVVPTEYELRRSTWSAPIVAVGSAGQFTWLTLQGIGSAIANVVTGNGSEAAKGVAGPVGIFAVLKDGTILGYQFILMIIAVISLTLAIMNILPIPALDGGRLFLTLFYRALNKPLTKKTEELVHGIGFAVLMLLFVLITVVDFKRFF